MTPLQDGQRVARITI
jgi:hypothetical protein